jgi:hypothetical protein
MQKISKVNLFIILFLLVSIIGTGAYIYTQKSKDKETNATNLNLNNNTSKARSISLEFPRISSNNIGLKVNPSVKYIDSVKKGDKLEEMISFEYSGDLEKANVQVDLSDFDINRTDCTQRQPMVDKTSANSALKYVSITKKSDNTAVLNIDLPSDIEPKTYWFGVKTSQKASDALTTSLYSVYFITVGDQRSEPCLIK